MSLQRFRLSSLRDKLEAAELLDFEAEKADKKKIKKAKVIKKKSKKRKWKKQI